MAIRISVNRGFGCSMGNMIDVVFGEAGELLREPSWIEVEETEPGQFEVVGNNMTSDRSPELGFSAWDDQVRDLDNGESDESQCFGMSCRLRWGRVYLSPDSFTAPSVRKLKEALKHVVYCAWDPDDI